MGSWDKSGESGDADRPMSAWDRINEHRAERDAFREDPKNWVDPREGVEHRYRPHRDSEAARIHEAERAGRADVSVDGGPAEVGEQPVSRPESSEVKGVERPNDQADSADHDRGADTDDGERMDGQSRTESDSEAVDDGNKAPEQDSSESSDRRPTDRVNEPADSREPSEREAPDRSTPTDRPRETSGASSDGVPGESGSASSAAEANEPPSSSGERGELAARDVDGQLPYGNPTDVREAVLEGGNVAEIRKEIRREIRDQGLDASSEPTTQLIRTEGDLRYELGPSDGRHVVEIVINDRGNPEIKEGEGKGGRVGRIAERMAGRADDLKDAVDSGWGKWHGPLGNPPPTGAETGLPPDRPPDHLSPFGGAGSVAIAVIVLLDLARRGSVTVYEKIFKRGEAHGDQ